MKTKLVTAFAAASLCFTQIKAADLCVNENGNNGCYATITAAINAATNGDRILVEPKAGHAPYVENLNINKSLYIICANDTDKYDVMGTLTVTPAIGRSITIIGMHHIGNIGTTGASPAGTRCSVSILGSWIEGNIAFDADYFNLTVASNIITGSIGMRFGKVIGNDITCNSGYSTPAGPGVIGINSDALPSNDTNLIIGNIIRNNAMTYTYGITINSNSQFGHVMNNLILCSVPSSGYTGGIYWYQFKNSSVSRNLVINNTVYSPGYLSMGIGFGTAPPANSYTDVINNLVMGTGGSYGSFWNATGTIGLSYNQADLAAVSSTDPCACNDFAAINTLNASGQPMAGSDAIDGGSPDFSYYDLNLTVNDVGAWGGSYSLTNFFPINGSTRVFLVQAPRRVNVSGSINIKAESFDR